MSEIIKGDPVYKCNSGNGKIHRSKNIPVEKIELNSGGIEIKYNKLKEENAKLLKKIEIQEKKIQQLQEINREQLEFSKQSYLPFCCVNKKGIIKEWNKALSEITGIPYESAINQNIEVLAEMVNTRKKQHENLLGKIEQILTSSFESPINYNYEEKIKNFSTGEITYVKVLLQPIISDTNKYVSILLNDITKEKRQEKELAQYSELIENILAENSAQLFHLTKYVNDTGNNTNDLVLQVEVVNGEGDFRILHLNNAAKSFYNISTLTDEVFVDIFDFLPGKIDYNVESFAEIENGIRFRSISKDKMRHWETFLYSITNNDNVNRLLFVSREITVQFEKDQLAFVLKSSIDSWEIPYWVCNENNEFVIQNLSSINIWGNQTGLPFDLHFFPEKVQGKIKAGLEKIYKGEGFTLQYKDHSKALVKHFLLKLTPMRKESGNIEGFSGLVYDITDRRVLEEKVLSSVIFTEEKERKYFSQELHDSVNPLLSAAGIYVDWLEKPNKSVSQQEVIGDIRKLLQEAHAATREISHRLSPHMLKKSGLDGAVKIYCERIKKISSIQIDVVSNMIKKPVEFVETALYRVMCECINNTLKHAEATKIKIDIQSDFEDIIIKYFDDGKGFDINEVQELQKGIGLLSIKNRIDYINGTVSIDSAPGKGFEMEIKVCNSCE